MTPIKTLLATEFFLLHRLFSLSPSFYIVRKYVESDGIPFSMNVTIISELFIYVLDIRIRRHTQLLDISIPFRIVFFSDDPRFNDFLFIYENKIHLQNLRLYHHKEKVLENSINLTFYIIINNVCMLYVCVCVLYVWLFKYKSFFGHTKVVNLFREAAFWTIDIFYVFIPFIQCVKICVKWKGPRFYCSSWLILL